MSKFPTKQEFLDLIVRVYPSYIGDLITGQKKGWERFSSMAEMYSYLGNKLKEVYENQLYSETAEGGQFATGNISIFWNANVTYPLYFPAYGLTVYGVAHGGKNLIPYQNTAAFTAGYGMEGYMPLTVAVQASRAGMTQDVMAKCLTVLFRNGDHIGSGDSLTSGGASLYSTTVSEFDLYRILEVTAASDGSLVGQRRQISAITKDGYGDIIGCDFTSAFDGPATAVSWKIVELADAGLLVRNEADIIGGNFYWLDLHGRNINVQRIYGESDADYLFRQNLLIENGSPNGIRRTLKKLADHFAPGYTFESIDILEGPICAAFFSETGDDGYATAPPWSTAIYEDPRTDPALMWTRQKSRSHFVVRVPDFAGEAWSSAQISRIYKSIYAAIEAIRPANITWDMIQVASTPP